MAERSDTRRLFRTATIAVVAVVLLVGLFVYLGVYDVAATSRHLPPTQWLLSTAADRSIRVSAPELAGPPAGTRIDREHGLIHYHEMCVACHAGPGLEPSEVGRGLNPIPPDFGEGTYRRAPGEVFWIVKNGIRMTGMPGFGPTHSDDEIWSIVAVLEELQNMDASEYRERTRALGMEAMQGGHGAQPEAGHVDPPGAAPHTH